jgi:choline dehydrogenase-like flavoprotein
VRRAKRILRGVGAWSFYTHEIKTFSHAVGTVRMGRDQSAAPLDEWCRFRGIDNLRVVDGSALPTSGAVNPSLTIAAVALRAADRLVREESA